MNAYLVSEPDGLTLIDTGLRATRRAILGSARALEQPIVRIALTHAHSDHVGSLDSLAAVLRGVEVLVSEREAPLLRGDRQLHPGEPPLRIRGPYPGARTDPTRTVGDGDRIGSLQVIATPGHSPGHISFLDTRDGTLYVGDVFTNKGAVATSAVVHPRFPLAGLYTWDRRKVLNSARRLLDLDPARLAPGHGRPLENPTHAMRRAIDAAICRN